MYNDPKKLFLGIGMLIGFFAILFAIFSPIFQGKNGLQFLDNLYNSISKGSAYYIPKVTKELKPVHTIPVDISLPKSELAAPEQVMQQYQAAGLTAQVIGANVRLQGNLGPMLASCLADAELLYHNKDQDLQNKYQFSGRQALYNWWLSLNLAEKDLKKQKKFKEAKAVSMVIKKAVEPSYNYAGIQPQNISDKWGIVLLSLVFYVAYTLWFGFGILFTFEGLGFHLEH